MDTRPASKPFNQPSADMAPVPAIDGRALLGIAIGPAVIAVLMSALAQSAGAWFGRDVVTESGGPVTLLLGTGVLLYAVFALMHGLHALGDALLSERTPLWWQPDLVTEESDVLLAPPAFPTHVDGAVLSGGLALASWLVLCLVA
ncbi:hypothetical protein [Arenibaculum pallidiluteum]|uniref:hypothetical protein n=1 Tax=Arenibaculum pallidiluteum TaxID=2812559 RepID=UPI001A96B03E|nr:hypothetical protein [Arenibaculum pallidiluteum]